MPRVIIGVPVYNGASLLRESLACLQGQSYKDFAVLVCDNASTDGSLEIAQEFAATDPRFRVIASAATIPAWDNFDRCLTLADAEYFAWRAHDDLSAPNFIEILAGLLDADPSAGLAACQVRTLKMNSGKTRTLDTPVLSASPLRARLQLLRHVHASWFYGLYRREAIAPLYRLGHKVYQHAWAGDHAILYALLAGRRVALSNQTWFLQRTGASNSRGRSNETDPALERRIFLDYLGFCRDRLDEIDLGQLQRLVLKAHLPLDAHRRAYRIGHLLRRALTG